MKQDESFITAQDLGNVLAAFKTARVTLSGPEMTAVAIALNNLAREHDRLAALEAEKSKPTQTKDDDNNVGGNPGDV